MNLYLTTHKYKNTFTEDLWEALGTASGKPVEKIMSTWTKQMGFPVLKVGGGWNIWGSIVVKLWASWVKVLNKCADSTLVQCLRGPGFESWARHSSLVQCYAIWKVSVIAYRCHKSRRATTECWLSNRKNSVLTENWKVSREMISPWNEHLCQNHIGKERWLCLMLAPCDAVVAFVMSYQERVHYG